MSIEKQVASANRDIARINFKISRPRPIDSGTESVRWPHPAAIHTEYPAVRHNTRSLQALSVYSAFNAPQFPIPLIARAMKTKIVVLTSATAIGVALIVLAAAVTFGGPAKPPPMQSIGNPFKDVDYSALPPNARYTARDGAGLAYRRYVPNGGQPSRGSVVLVHGSSANSQSLHPLAQSLANAGFTVYAMDMRGHGASGPRGDIAYLGQLDDDMEDFMKAEHPAGPKTLLGFSAGGGFAIRVAGGSRQAMFDDYVFLAPYTNRRAANFRPNGGGWVSVGIPRMVAIALLNRIGITGFNHLPVVDFAVSDSPVAQLTPAYSYALSKNFQPRDDYLANIHDIREPAAVLDGQDDEVFIAGKFAQVFADAGRSDIGVTIVPDTGHITLTLNPVARAAAVSAVERLNLLVRSGPAKS